jgi:lytic murein transglycosylase
MKLFSLSRTRRRALGAAATICLALTAMPAAAQDTNARFQSWLEGTLWPQAQSRNVSRATFDSAFRGVRPNLDLPDLVRPGQEGQPPQVQHQAEFGNPANYFAENIVAGVASGGRSRVGRHAQTLASLEQRFGVPGGIAVAIWGRESGFGSARIPHNAFEVLGTKAFMARRAEMYVAEVLAALEMAEFGIRQPGDMRSSWAGALGQPQFLPTSYLRYAIDGDGDGRADIWSSEPDTLASIANYLAAKGWQAGREWGFEVSVPQSVSCALEGPDRGKRFSEWAAMGVSRIGGRAFPQAEMAREGFLLMPAGRLGPAFIVTQNFYVLKEYNESDLYALFVGHAADRIAHGDFRFQGTWSRPDALTRGDVAALQRALIGQGFDTGGADGLAGFRTRRSIGEWQQRNGRTATCFPDAATVNSLR